MPRHIGSTSPSRRRPPQDPATSLFNEILDAAVDSLIDTMEPQFQRLAKTLVTDAKRKADAYAKQSQEQTHTNTTRSARAPRPPASPKVKPPQTTHYDTLEVSPRASQETIEAAYKSLARKHHPDMGGKVSTMQDITAAYSVLKVHNDRNKYDRSLGLVR